MKIAFFDSKPYDIESFEKQNQNGEFEFKFFETKLNADTASLAHGFDAVCIFVNDIADSTVIDILCEMGIKLILLRCAGFNNVDTRYAYEKIHIFRVPAYSPYAVAEHAMAMLLTSVRRIHKAYIRTKDFNFRLAGLTGFDLHGKTVGIVGTGKIGKVFADICRGFGMKVIAYDKFPDEKSGIEYKSLDEIFSQSDIISFHCPLNNESYNMVNRESVSKMKKGVILINTSRGALIDSEALLEGIKERKIGGACLDVYDEESDIFFEDFSGHIVEDDVIARLISMPNVIITSHQAFLTNEALTNIAQTTLENARDFIKNGGGGNELCYHCGSTLDCKNIRKERCF
ncbi:MAG: 2-hydroxyacid dehydrogenase [Clostridiales bacterium]|nr:2-hydroxyacid dehydrogenase [Candidatus Equinaster intestinalis]